MRQRERVAELRRALPPGATPAAAQAAGVQDGSGISFTNVKINNGGTDIVNGIDPGTINDVYRFDWQRGGSNALVSRLGANGALVEEQFAKSHKLSPGDTFRVTSATGARLTLRVIGQYKDPVLFGGFMVSTGEYGQLSTETRYRQRPSSWTYA